MAAVTRKRSARNQTLTLSEQEQRECHNELLFPEKELSEKELSGRILCGDLFQILPRLPDAFVDLLILDPPYNLGKDFNGMKFGQMSDENYIRYLESWFPKLLRLLKPTASVYLCGDWKCSAAQYFVMNKYLHVRNRITWQREKGRGACSNWKNSCEDIWFGTCSQEYYFDVDAVKVRRKVIAPYRQDGKPKDWEETDEGNFRITHPSNFWDDITVPYWSMPENTDHPTQKPEKLIAKLILASSRPGDFVFDPFGGSGTTPVVAKKLGRCFASVEMNPEYAAWGIARLKRAESDPRIQGYEKGIFWERNSALHSAGKKQQKRELDT
ncbi:MAG: site-specific DNA-methyltransferase [Lentisphaeria bacterium]|nr:site-specific DNA-methyltransferase [Lentisphaeria bacterium]